MLISALIAISETSLSRTLCRASRSHRERHGKERRLVPFKNMSDRRDRPKNPWAE